MIQNRKIYTELEARLLSGETERVHQARAELTDHQNRWRDAMWIIHKQTWMWMIIFHEKRKVFFSYFLIVSVRNWRNVEWNLKRAWSHSVNRWRVKSLTNVEILSNTFNYWSKTKRRVNVRIFFSFLVRSFHPHRIKKTHKNGSNKVIKSSTQLNLNVKNFLVKSKKLFFTKSIS